MARCLKIAEKSHFLKLEVYDQILLPDRSIFIGQTLIENAKNY